jgi:hypothetical protein
MSEWKQNTSRIIIKYYYFGSSCMHSKFVSPLTHWKQSVLGCLSLTQAYVQSIIESRRQFGRVLELSEVARHLKL